MYLYYLVLKTSRFVLSISNTFTNVLLNGETQSSSIFFDECCSSQVMRRQTAFRSHYARCNGKNTLARCLASWHRQYVERDVAQPLKVEIAVLEQSHWIVLHVNTTALPIERQHSGVKQLQFVVHFTERWTNDKTKKIFPRR